MQRRQPRQKQSVHRKALPKLWLLSDERMGSGLDAAIRQLPAGSGVIIRHYSLSETRRIALAKRIGFIARRRGLLLLWSGPIGQVHNVQADGVHVAREALMPPRSVRPKLLRSAPVHDLRAIRRAENGGADVLLLSPVFATRSHPDAPIIGPMRAAALARATQLPVLALGGMTPQRAMRMERLGLYGCAGIDIFVR
jgi:thiamine-phosphate pyrophosphorylase